MKVRINGKIYNTATAKRISAVWDNGRARNDLFFESFAVYMKRTREFFVHGEGGAATAWGFEDKNRARSFGEGIFPIPEYALSAIGRAINSERVRIVRGSAAESACVEEPSGENIILIGCNSRFAPAAENSGGKVG